MSRFTKTSKKCVAICLILFLAMSSMWPSFAFADETEGSEDIIPEMEQEAEDNDEAALDEDDVVPDEETQEENEEEVLDESVVEPEIEDEQLNQEESSDSDTENAETENSNITEKNNIVEEHIEEEETVREEPSRDAATITLETPTGLTMTDETSYSFTLSWNKVEGASYYRIYRLDEDDDSGEWSSYMSTNEDETSISISSALGAYLYAVTAVGEVNPFC